MYCLTVLEAGSPKSSCQRDHASSAGSRGESLTASSSSCWFPVTLGCSLACGHTTPVSASVVTPPSPPYPSSVPVCLCVQIFPFYKDTSPFGSRPALMTSPELDLQRLYLQIRSHSQLPVGRASTYLFTGDTAQP